VRVEEVMKQTIIIIVFLITMLKVAAQKPPREFGDIPMEDMIMKVYPQDSSAAAVVLFDFGLTYASTITSGQSIIYTWNFARHIRVKILKKEGLHWADSRMALHESQHLDQFKGATYNLVNGQIVKTELSDAGKFRNHITGKFNLEAFALPNVREGSVIELSYTSSRSLPSNWRFQQSIPVRLSEYWLLVPQEEFEFVKYMQGSLTLTSYTDERMDYSHLAVTGHHYVMREVPAFKIEPYLTTENDYVSQINLVMSHFKFHNDRTPLEIVGSWEKLNEVLLNSEYFGLLLGKSNFSREEVEKIIAGVSKPIEQIAAISNYVKSNFEWDTIKRYSTTSSSLKAAFEKKKGNSADLNFLFGSMLKKAGFNVEMIILSTRDHGYIRKLYPDARQFNYVICSVKINGNEIQLDATEHYLPFDVLPERCLNGEGLKISKPKSSWVKIISNAKGKTFVNVNLKVGELGELKGEVNYSGDGYEALKMRKEYFKKGKDNYRKDFLSSKQWKVEKTEFKDMEDLPKSAKVFCNVSIDEHAVVAGDVVYLNPYVISRIEETPFKSITREYPVDYGNKIDKTYRCTIALHEDLMIDELPKNIAITLPENSAKFVFSTSVTNNVINVTSNFQINKVSFLPNEYDHLREFYSQVVAKQAEEIVLRKKIKK